jgi:hypothetical protein
MATITGAVVRVATSGQVVPADCFGNNAAVECPACLCYPVLLIARAKQRGHPPPIRGNAATVVRESISRMTSHKMSSI